MQIIQSPDHLSFSGNLKDIILSESGNDSVQVQLYETGNAGNPILDEIYTPDPDGRIFIDVKSVLTEFVTTEIPSLNTLDADVSGMLKSYTLNCNGQTCIFSVIPGGINQDEDTSAFLCHNFLTWRQGLRSVRSGSVIFLFYIAREDCLFKLLLQYADLETSELTVALSENDCRSFNLSPSFLKTLIKKEIISYEARIEAYAGYNLTDKAIFQVTDLSDNAKEYLYINSLGGIDTITFSGAYSKTVKTQTALSLHYTKFVENKIDYSAIHKQNTGYLTADESVLVTDFLLSKSRFYLFENKLIPIVIEETENEFTEHKLNAFEFEYQFAEQSGYQHLRHKEGLMPEQLPPFFDRVGACFDQRKGNRIIDRTHGYVATLSADGLYIDFPQLSPDVLCKQNTDCWYPGIPLLVSERQWKLSELTGTHTINYATELCTKTLFFRDITNDQIITALPIIVYKSALTEAEIQAVLKYLKDFYFIYDPPDRKLLTDNEITAPDSIYIIDNSKTK